MPCHRRDAGCGDNRRMAFSFLDDPLDRAEHLRTDSAALARLWPEARVLVLDGAGNAWVDADGLPPQLTGTAVGARPDSAVFLGLHGPQAWFALPAADAPAALAAQPAGLVYRLRQPLHPLSATAIRARVADGLSIDGLVPPAVAAFIREKGAYRQRPEAPL